MGDFGQIGVLMVIMLLVHLSKKRIVSVGDGTYLVRYGLGMKLIAFLAILVFLYVSLDFFIGLQGLTTDWRVPLLLAVLFVPCGTEFFFRRIEFSEKKIVAISPWSGRKEFTWDDVTDLRYEAFPGLYILEVEGVGNVWVPDSMCGAEFLVDFYGYTR